MTDFQATYTTFILTSIFLMVGSPSSEELLARISIIVIFNIIYWLERWLVKRERKRNTLKN